MTLTAVVLSILMGLVSSDGGDEILGCAGFAKVSRSLRQHHGKSASAKIDYSAVTVGLAIHPRVAFCVIRAIEDVVKYDWHGTCGLISRLLNTIMFAADNVFAF